MSAPADEMYPSVARLRGMYRPEELPTAAKVRDERTLRGILPQTLGTYPAGPRPLHAAGGAASLWGIPVLVDASVPPDELWLLRRDGATVRIRIGAAGGVSCPPSRGR